MTVYADVLFLVNFSMDIITLYLSGRIIRNRILKHRLLLASAFGAVIATLYTIAWETLPWNHGSITILVGLVTSYGMTAIAFGGRVKAEETLRCCIIVWGAGALLGGVMTVVTSIGTPSVISEPEGFVQAVGVCAVAGVAVVRLLSSAKSKKILRVSIFTCGKTYELDAIGDSGSYATEPISGLPVIIVKSTVVSEVVPMLESGDPKLKIRIVPIKGICGDGILRGFVPDEARVDGRTVSAVIAVDKTGGSYSGHSGIVPAALINS